ncbi:MAG TPA: hypothetical protein VKT78_14435 [Fimbriimonadaceae bacterium]|nr:hypothetical protein [Fimbriimonadaceae bacterium]
MNLAVKRLDLLWDGDLPRDSMAGEKHRHLFGEAKPLIDYAFKVDRPAFVRVWWFDRHLDRVVDFERLGARPRLGHFYLADYLRSETDRLVADYLSELGWQVRFTLKSIKRREFAVLAVFSAQGATLQENDRYRLKTLVEAELPPVDDWMPPIWPNPRPLREFAGR